jgi:plasmid stability protein
MSVMIQIRNVPDSIHRTLKARAALKGMSLSDYLLEEMRKITSQPTIEELCRRLSEREPVVLKESAADAVRAERDAR